MLERDWANEMERRRERGVTIVVAEDKGVYSS
jgi:hypothetical protein